MKAYFDSKFQNQKRKLSLDAEGNEKKRAKLEKAVEFKCKINKTQFEINRNICEMINETLELLHDGARARPRKKTKSD